AGVELVLGGGPKGKGEFLKAGEEPKAIAGKADPKAARKNDGNFLGVWTGTFPGTKEQLTLNIVKNRTEWDVEGFVMSAENKRLAYFKHGGGKMDAEGKSISLTPTWMEKAAPISGEPALTLTSQPKALRAEFADPKQAEKVTID